MKKLFSLLVVFSLIVALFVPGMVLAADKEDEPVAPQASCTHTAYGYTSTYTYKYTIADGSVHYIYKIEHRQCKNCLSYYYAGAPVSLGKADHQFTGEKYVRSVHDGDPSSHYYVMSNSCKVCNYKYERTKSTLCRSGNCNYINSTGRPEIK